MNGPEAAHVRSWRLALALAALGLVAAMVAANLDLLHRIWDYGSLGRLIALLTSE